MHFSGGVQHARADFQPGVFGSIQVDYNLGLNILALAIFVALFGLTVRRGVEDPICGMTVEVATARHQSDWAGRSVYFCCRHCKETFDAEPARYAAALAG